MSFIKGGINFQELLSTGTTFQVDPESFNEEDSDNEVSKEEYEENLVKYANLNCIGDFEDDEVYDASEPFEILALKMNDLLDNGQIKKRVLQKGYGNKPEDNCIVRVQYNAYTEYKEEPFDSTYARKKPLTFIIGKGEVVPGLDHAIQSMQLNEKSQFLVKPELAYGKFGCLDRIPANSTILFEVELLEIIESAAAENFQNLPEEKKSQFPEVYKFCMSQCAKAKDLFTRNIQAAIREYNIAGSMLERAQLNDYEDQVKQQQMLYKLYSNLLICFTKIEEPKKACINFNKINHMAKGTDLKISAKVYYNNAKCLRMLGDFDLAKKRLRKALDLEPRNPEILNESAILDEESRKYNEKQKKIAEAFISGKPSGKH